MESQKRHICLFIDNFSGHFISYEPHNITLEYFEPNLTSFVQPLDAGIIWCFKAYYRRAFCTRAIELDEAGAENIYKINLLEGMLMVKEAWKAVSDETIRNCWDHTKIQLCQPCVGIQLVIMLTDRSKQRNQQQLNAAHGSRSMGHHSHIRHNGYESA